MSTPRDHGGGIDAAASCFGGSRSEWLVLSTGINRVPYPIGSFTADDWTALPDRAAMARLEAAARQFWDVPQDAGLCIAPGASALIARLPGLVAGHHVDIARPTYNEHAAAFVGAGWQMADQGQRPEARVVVHPNNPDGRLWSAAACDGVKLAVIDESFCDVCPDQSLIAEATRANVVILKSFGKFWGLAGVRLGFAIGAPELTAALRDALGPWPVAGPALRLGAEALEDPTWAQKTRARLARDAARLDRMLGWEVLGGTDLFRLYRVADAEAAQARLARGRVWTRIFPYAHDWIRVGLPGPEGEWAQLEAAL